jgi:hypothetical protein
VVTASVTAVRGAVGYAWFCGTTDGTAPNLKLFSVTTINSVVITSIPVGAEQVLPTDLVTNDRSVNALLFDGLLTLATKSGSNAYFSALSTGTAGTGTSLSGDAAGGITEIDEMLKSMWDNQRLSVDQIWVSSQEMQTLRKKIMASSSTSALRFTFNVAQGNLSGGTMIRGYLNPYSMTGATEIPIRLHPFLPKGTILGVAHKLPYRASGVDNVMQILTRKEYYQLEWPLKSRKYEYGVYTDEVLQHYAPFSMGVITNVAPG